jgi:hypothetical protein
MNAEPAISTKEAGRRRLLRNRQPTKSSSGIVLRLDGGSNVTDDNLTHCENTDSPSVETEDGTVKEVRKEQLKKAAEPILRIAAGDSKQTIVNPQQASKHFSPIEKTLRGTVIERSFQQFEKERAGKLCRRERESKVRLSSRTLRVKLPSNRVEMSALTQKCGESPTYRINC